MDVVCISSSNIVHQNSTESTSYKICQIATKAIAEKMGEAHCTIIELKDKAVQPCIGCGKCINSHRCIYNDDFNSIYEQLINADIVFIVSPHYAPIPAKLSALLEKMEQITFLHWGKNNSYKSEVFGKPTGVISHGGGEAWALKSYKRMVNDTIANALETIQLRLVPYNEEWDTGISLPVKKTIFQYDSVFPNQEYDWDFIANKVSEYVDMVVTAINYPV